MSVGSLRLPGGRRLGTRLMLAFTVGWFLTMITLQFVQASQHGYGSGFGDGGRVPPEVVEQVGVGDDVEALVQTTSRPGSGGGAFGDVWRIVFSVAVLLGIIFFWYVVMSRVGSF
ncbi:MAG: hypothetical protein ACRD0O_14335 [Acidimicrobiia bacterium]